MEKERCNNGDSKEKGLKKGPWSKEEDEILKAYMTKKEESNWNSVSKNSGLSRCFRSCRLRWNNHLDKRVKKGPFSEEEARIVFELRTGGLRWSEIARKVCFLYIFMCNNLTKTPVTTSLYNLLPICLSKTLVDLN